MDTRSDLARNGVTTEIELNPDELGAVIELEKTVGHEYWLGLNNFYVITRYNHSPLYAMAVHQLGQAILDNRKIKNRKMESRN